MIGKLLEILSWTAGLKMKNLSSKPVTGKTWRRKTFNLAVVAIHFHCSAISGWVLFRGPTPPSFRLLLVRLLLVRPSVSSSSFSFCCSRRRGPFQGMGASIFRHGSLHLRHGYLRFQAWMPPFQGMDASNFKLAHPFWPYAGIAYAWAGGPSGRSPLLWWEGAGGGRWSRLGAAGPSWISLPWMVLPSTGLGVVKPPWDWGIARLIRGSWHPPSPAPLQGGGLCSSDTYFSFIRRARLCVMLILPSGHRIHCNTYPNHTSRGFHLCLPRRWVTDVCIAAMLILVSSLLTCCGTRTAGGHWEGARTEVE